MSREQMARELGVTAGTITRWTRDKGRPPLPPVLRDWARMCDVPYEWLTQGEGSVEMPVAYDRAADPDVVKAERRMAAHLAATETDVTHPTPERPR